MENVTNLVSLVVLLLFLAGIIGLIIMIFKLVRSITGISDTIFGIGACVDNFFEKRKKKRFRFYVKKKDRTLIDIGYKREDEDES